MQVPKLQLLLYTWERLIRNLIFNRGLNQVLFEYVEPLELNDNTFMPDYDLTHLTVHRNIAKFLERKGYKLVELAYCIPVPKNSFLKRILYKMGLWGSTGDTLLIMQKPEEKTEPQLIKTYEKLIYKQSSIRG